MTWCKNNSQTAPPRNNSLNTNNIFCPTASVHPEFTKPASGCGRTAVFAQTVFTTKSCFHMAPQSLRVNVISVMTESSVGTTVSNCLWVKYGRHTAQQIWDTPHLLLPQMLYCSLIKGESRCTVERWRFPSVHRRYIHLALCSGSKVSQQMSVHQQNVIIWLQKIQNTNYIGI